MSCMWAPSGLGTSQRPSARAGHNTGGLHSRLNSAPLVIRHTAAGSCGGARRGSRYSKPLRLFARSNVAPLHPPLPGLYKGGTPSAPHRMPEALLPTLCKLPGVGSPHRWVPASPPPHPAQHHHYVAVLFCWPRWAIYSMRHTHPRLSQTAALARGPITGHAATIMKDTCWSTNANSQAKQGDNPTVRQGRGGPWVGVQRG